MSDMFPIDYDPDRVDDETAKKVHRLYENINVKLGGTSITVYLEREDYDVAFEEAIRTLRQYSTRSINRGGMFLRLDVGKTVYKLPAQIDEVRKILRSGMGFSLTMTDGLNPFLQKMMSSVFGSGSSTIGGGDTETYVFSLMYLNDLRKIFGREIPFTYLNSDKLLRIHSTPRREETVLLEVSVLKSIRELLTDHWSYNWLERFTQAVCMEILGNKLTIVTPMPGPQAGVTLNGGEMKTQGAEMKNQLIEEIFESGDSGEIPLPMIG